MKRRLISNQFIATKGFLNGRMINVTKEWEAAEEANKSTLLCHTLKCKFWNLADANAKLAGMKLRHF